MVAKPVGKKSSEIISFNLTFIFFAVYKIKVWIAKIILHQPFIEYVYISNQTSIWRDQTRLMLILRINFLALKCTRFYHMYDIQFQTVADLP